jgi:prepilin-type N-terminal cleavage/methylation domain-containing protein/prepilin-type processing-associated H-X9-DG protein
MYNEESPQRRAGFTLVELLVVIGIIAVLIAVLLPALARAKAQANSVACRSNIRQIATAAMLYAHDHKVWVGFAPGIDRKMLLYPYLRQGKSNADVDGTQVWHCPANAMQQIQASYGFNVNLNWVKITKIKRWSETVALCDGGVLDSTQPTLITHVWPPSRPTSASAVRPNARHAGGMVNAGFADGHVEVFPMKEPFYPGPAGQWMGNGVIDPEALNYKDQIWDLK